MRNSAGLHRTAAGVLGEICGGQSSGPCGLGAAPCATANWSGSGWVWPWVGWMALAYVRSVLGEIHMAIRCLMGMPGVLWAVLGGSGLRLVAGQRLVLGVGLRTGTAPGGAMGPVLSRAEWGQTVGRGRMDVRLLGTVVMPGEETPR